MSAAGGQGRGLEHVEAAAARSPAVSSPPSALVSWATAPQRWKAAQQQRLQLLGRRLGVGAEHVRGHQDAIAQRRHQADPPDQ